jgi:Zn-dependent protease with chaperone function
MAVGAVLSFAGLYLLFRICLWMLPRFQRPWKLRGLDDWAALPALFLIAGILQFLGQPLGAGFSRHVEHQADIYGLEVTHGINRNSQEAAARAFQTLGEQSLSYPNPEGWLVFWYYSHPPDGERLKFAREYDPWGKGGQGEFVK